MAAALAAAAFVAGAKALTAGQASCCFSMEAYGGPGGVVGELYDGQARINQSNLQVSKGSYCLSKGALTDSYGRGCILTPPTGQLQCDAGATPDTGFTISCDGTVSINGTSTFWSCPTGDHGGWNIYDKPVNGQEKCAPISLIANGCASDCATASLSSTMSSASTGAVGTSSAGASSISQASSTTSHVDTMSSTITMSPSVSTLSSTSTMSPPISATSYISTLPSISSLGSALRDTSSIGASSTLGYTSPLLPATSSMALPPPVTTANKPYSPSVTTETDCTTFTPSMSRATESVSTSVMYNDAHSCPPPMSTMPIQPKACPGKLDKDFEFPHLIIHIDSAKPDKSYGNFMNGTMTSTISSMYNFDVPSSAAGKTCTLEFMFPTYDQLETSSYAISGDGKAEFYTLTKPAAKDDTFNHSPASDKYLGEYSLTPGSASTVGSMACPAGQTVGIWMVSATGSSLNYFQDSNPCPIGLFMNVA